MRKISRDLVCHTLPPASFWKTFNPSTFLLPDLVFIDAHLQALQTWHHHFFYPRPFFCLHIHGPRRALPSDESTTHHWWPLTYYSYHPSSHRSVISEMWRDLLCCKLNRSGDRSVCVCVCVEERGPSTASIYNLPYLASEAQVEITPSLSTPQHRRRSDQWELTPRTKEWRFRMCSLLSAITCSP